MPGIVGIASEKYASEGDRLDDLSRMAGIISTSDRCIKDDVYSDSRLCGVRIHNNIFQKHPQPLRDSGVYVWLEGEFSNQDELLAELGQAGLTDPEILLALFMRRDGFSFLKRIDGIFSAVIYDSENKKVHLITDRYGLRYLYWMHRNGSLIWSSELKGFTALKGYQPTINRRALKQFIGVGYVLENETWFEDVQLLASGSVLSFDITSGRCDSARYWWWDEIRPISGAINEDDIVDEMGELFKSSVEHRCRTNDDVGITLSGGLDSRSILAAMPDRDSPIKALTFGEKGCDDVRFAKRAAAVKGAEHHVMDLSVENWLAPRIEMVWLNDGFEDIQHAGGAGDLIASLYSINLGGIALDVVLGGGFVYDEMFFDEITPDKKALLASEMECDEALLDSFSSYVGLRKTDFFYLQNRVRRFTYSGSVSSRGAFEDRAPALDNRLLEFAYSIPDKLRHDSYIYKKMLLRYFPKYFKSIPWQNTGMPISYSPFRQKIHRRSHALIERVRNRLNTVGVSIRERKEFASYEQWIRQDPAKSFFEKLLCASDALYREYIPSSEVMAAFDQHMSGENRVTPLCRYLTVELWLQQVYEGKYRNGME